MIGKKKTIKSTEPPLILSLHNGVHNVLSNMNKVQLFLDNYLRYRHMFFNITRTYITLILTWKCEKLNKIKKLVKLQCSVGLSLYQAVRRTAPTTPHHLFDWVTPRVAGKYSLGFFLSRQVPGPRVQIPGGINATMSENTGTMRYNIKAWHH